VEVFIRVAIFFFHYFFGGIIDLPPSTTRGGGGNLQKKNIKALKRVNATSHYIRMFQLVISSEASEGCGSDACSE